MNQRWTNYKLVAIINKDYLYPLYKSYYDALFSCITFFTHVISTLTMFKNILYISITHNQKHLRKLYRAALLQEFLQFYRALQLCARLVQLSPTAVH